MLQQVTGSAASAVSSVQVSDPYGIRIAFRPGHPLALLTWRQYIAIVTRISRTVEQQLQSPALEALAAFNRERHQLVGVGHMKACCLLFAKNTPCQVAVMACWLQWYL